MQIKEIQTKEEIAESFSVLTQIYQNLHAETYIEDLLTMMQSGYKMIGVFEDHHIENGRCIGIAGIRIVQKLNYGKVIEIEDFIIDRQKRGVGVGKMLIRFIEWQAALFGCQNIIGNLETKRQESQKIFAREGFLLDGFFFKK